MASARRRLLVVAALAFDEAGAVLLSQRRPDQSLPLLWELPGGKVEVGETPAQALARELNEEIGVSARVGELVEVIDWAYPTFDLLMLVYRVELEGTPRAVEVADVRYVGRAELPSYAFPPADQPLVDRLVAGDLA